MKIREILNICEDKSFETNIHVYSSFKIYLEK